MSDVARVPDLFTTSAMAQLFSPEEHVKRLLVFERALAEAEGELGVIPADAVRAIAACCGAEGFDVAALYGEAATVGTVVVPLVRAIAERAGPEAGRFVHWGTTSQDAIDTATALQMRDGLGLLAADLVSLGDACLRHAERHRATVMAGRTLLQQAVPISFGLKAARWLALTGRQLRAIRRCADESLALQFGGAAGTLAALGSAGESVAERLGARLRLPVPDVPWHAERDRVASLVATLSVVAGAMAKIATDIVLLAQTEIGEAAEGRAEGKGASSAMPQKRNPVDATTALAAARLAIGAAAIILGGMAQEHERAAGAWQAEWAAVPNVFRYTAGAVAAAGRAVASLSVDPRRMRANLDAAGGAIMAESLTTALAAQLGRPEATDVVAAVLRVADERGGSLRDAASQEPRVTRVLTRDALDRALDPAQYLGATEELIDRAIAGYRRTRDA